MVAITSCSNAERFHKKVNIFWNCIYFWQIDDSTALVDLWSVSMIIVYDARDNDE
jgi:hypothetical protein